ATWPSANYRAPERAPNSSMPPASAPTTSPPRPAVLSASPGLHGHLDAPLDQPGVSGPGREEPDHHADLHQQPEGSRTGREVVRRREEHERHDRHPAE